MAIDFQKIIEFVTKNFLNFTTFLFIFIHGFTFGVIYVYKE